MKADCSMNSQAELMIQGDEAGCDKTKNTNSFLIMIALTVNTGKPQKLLKEVTPITFREVCVLSSIHSSAICPLQ